MAGWLDRLKQALVPPGPGAGPDAGSPGTGGRDETIALGVLLWEVARADGRLLEVEKTQIVKALEAHGGVDADRRDLLLATVERAAKESIDLYSFAREVADGLPPASRVELVKHLFRVAGADGHLAFDEVETIRLISGLLRVPHEGFIAAKLAVKAELAR